MRISAQALLIGSGFLILACGQSKFASDTDKGVNPKTKDAVVQEPVVQAGGQPLPPSPAPSPAPAPVPAPAPEPKKSLLLDKNLIGYWHNFNNEAGFIKLRDVSPDFDVINVAFGVAADASQRIVFVPFNYTPDEFKQDVATVRGRGKRVMLSLGGEAVTIRLNTEAQKNAFIESVAGIINTYGFDGIDIDMQGASVTPDAGDTDFKNPKTAAVVNLIAAIRELQNRFAGKFILTISPDLGNVQSAYTVYSGNSGSYLPLLYALRDTVDIVTVQHYHTTSFKALDNKIYNAGTADFHVAAVDMLMNGFPVGGDANNFFPALNQEQVAIGIPANAKAAGVGFTPASEAQKAVSYLTKGISYGGQYQLKNPAGYRAIRGIMTWSVNWDAFSNFEFSKTHRPFLDTFTEVEVP